MNKYCDIISNTEEDFCDFSFDIIKYKKKLFGNIYIECAANDNSNVVGFELELKNGMTGLNNGNIDTWHTYIDGIKINFVDNLSESLIDSIIKYYKLNLTNLKLNKSSIIECGSLTENQLDYNNKLIQFKCFVDSSNEKNLYAEFYINIDLKNKKVYFNEKSTEYRENIVRYLGTNNEKWTNTKEIKVMPLNNVNNIKYGINRNELWNKVGKPLKSFRKTNLSKVDTDDYKNFHVYYDSNYNFEAIEIFGDDIDIYFNNVKLPKKYSEILNYFKNIYDDIEEDENGFVSKKGSIGVYVENDDDKIDSILFGCKDYYNK